MNAVINLWVSFSGRTLLYEVSFLPVQEILLQPVCLLSGSCVSASQSGLDTFLCSQKVLKYAVTNVIEFQSSRRNILMKIHANIFV